MTPPPSAAPDRASAEPPPAAGDDDGRRPPPFAVRRVGVAAPARWLARGARDFRARPLPCLFYGLCFAAMGWLLGALLRTSPGMMMALTAGFLLMGPFMAMGVYEVARCAEAGVPCRLSATTVAWRRNLSNIAILGIGMGVLMALWARASMMVIAIFFPRRMPSVAVLLEELAHGRNLEFVVAWFAVGAIFAMLVFAFTVVAIPMMLDRGTDAITAMIASAAAVARNPLPMATWSVAIVALTVVGFATLFVGLVVTVPWVGLATWHAYRDLVEPKPAAH